MYCNFLQFHVPVRVANVMKEAEGWIIGLPSASERWHGFERSFKREPQVCWLSVTLLQALSEFDTHYEKFPK